MVLTIRILLVRLAFAWARFLPLQRRVVFATAHADELGGNLAILRDELATHHSGVRVVSLAHRPGRGIRRKGAAAWHAVVAAAYLATSRVFVVDDYFFPIYVVAPRTGTTIIQTWHACGAFKKIGYSVLDKSFGMDDELARRVRVHSNYDVCLMASRSAAVHYAEAFRQPLDDRTGGRRDSDLVDADDAHEALVPETALMAEGRDDRSHRPEAYRNRTTPPKRRGRRFARRTLAVRAPLAQGRCLADAVAQEVELRTPGDAVTDDLDLLDARAVDLEGPLDADAGRDAPDSDGTGDPATTEAHDGPLEDLDALAVALDDLGGHLHGVTGRELREVGAKLVLDDLVEHGHGLFLTHLGSRGCDSGFGSDADGRRRRSIARPRGTISRAARDPAGGRASARSPAHAASAQRRRGRRTSGWPERPHRERQPAACTAGTRGGRRRTTLRASTTPRWRRAPGG